MASLGAVLEQYPNEVIVYVTDPRTGVQRGCKWPPTISEIVEACDNRIAAIKRNDRFQNWGRNDPLALEPPREARPTIEQMKAKYGENYGLTPNPPNPKSKRAPSWNEIVSTYSADPSRLQRLLKRADDWREASTPTEKAE